MTTLLTPIKFKGVKINGEAELDTQVFELPIPAVISGIVPAAGGANVDLNYGNGAPSRPKPFTIMMTCQASTSALFATAFNAFFGLPPVGFLGLTGTFVCKEHGTLNELSCTAELSSYSFTQDLRWYTYQQAMISGMSVVFKPVDHFS